MARQRRVKCDHDAYYHVMSRTNDRRFLLKAPAIKADMVDSLRRAAEFSGVVVIGYTIMDNHFHIACKVPKPKGTVPEDEVLRRVAVIKGSKAAEMLCERWKKMRADGQGAVVEAQLKMLRIRMHDLSQFVKTFKEVFGLRFRRRTRYDGCVWAGRFKSVLLGDREDLRKCIKYIELNPVRAGICKLPEEYRWCSVGAARRNEAFALSCRMAHAAEMGTVPMDELASVEFLRRIPQFSAGLIMGCEKFVKEALVTYRIYIRSRNTRPRKVIEGVYTPYGHRLAKEAS